MKAPPAIQIAVGAAGCLLFLTGAIWLGAHATSTFAWIRAYGSFISAWALAGQAWNGYKRLPKTPQSNSKI